MVALIPELDQLVIDAMTDWRVPGAALAVVQDGKVALLKAYGYFRALPLGDAALAAPIDKLSVVLVTVFGVTILGERLSGLNWLGITLIAGGAILVAHRG